MLYNKLRCLLQSPPPKSHFSMTVKLFSSLYFRLKSLSSLFVLPSRMSSSMRDGCTSGQGQNDLNNPWLQTQHENEIHQDWSKKILLSACFIKTYILTVWHCFSKIEQDHNMKNMCLALSKCETTRFRIDIPMRIKTISLELTNGVRA